MAATNALPRVPVFIRDQILMQNIYLFQVLSSDAAMARLQAARNAIWKKTRFQETEQTRALSVGINALSARIDDYMLSTQACGQLLMCWHGTKAIGEGAYQ